MKPCYIHQPWGIGDLIFIQKIVGLFRQRGHDVVVPVRPDLLWAQQHLGRPGIRYLDMTASFEMREEFAQLTAYAERLTPDGAIKGAWETDRLLFLPLGPCYKWCGEPNWMLSKYAVLDLDGSDWASHVRVVRDRERERRLLTQLEIRDGEPFCLVNGQGSLKQLKLSVEGIRNVQMRILDGFTLFDWAAVVERASAIATIDTSLVLLIEVLKPSVPLAVVSRHDPPHFDHLRPIVRLPWHFVPTAAGPVVFEQDLS